MSTLTAYWTSTVAGKFLECFIILKDFSNPFYLSILVSIIISILFYFALKSMIIPLRKKQNEAKCELELQAIRLSAIFADLDPDPVLRIDHTGVIVFVNPSAEKRGFTRLIGRNLYDLFSIPGLEIGGFISMDRSSNFYGEFEGKFYSVQLCGISHLNMLQVYLHEITELKEYQKTLENSKDEITKFSKNLQKEIEEERLRISRELHDNIGQKLVLLRLNLQKKRSKDTTVEDNQFYEDTLQLVDTISKDVKDVAHTLEPSSIKEIGLSYSLRLLVKTVERQCMIKGDITFIGLEERIAPDIETSVYRIVQEALSNIIKHSKAKQFQVQLIRNEEYLKLIISDDGEGFNIENINPRISMGIKNMKARAENLLGTFKISSSPSEGTIISVKFPTGE